MGFVQDGAVEGEGVSEESAWGSYGRYQRLTGISTISIYSCVTLGVAVYPTDGDEMPLGYVEDKYDAPPLNQGEVVSQGQDEDEDEMLLGYEGDEFD